MRFDDRIDAGRRLAQELLQYKSERPVVLALPRGGVPVAYEVARALEAPLDVLVARKIGAPFEPELGVGAIAEGDAVYLDPNAELLGLGARDLEPIIARERAELARRVARFRRGRPLPPLRGRTVILVDDGIATGGTARAALRALAAASPSRLVLAVPVAAAQSLPALRREVDELVCLLAPADLMAIGNWYRDFEQVDDSEVVELLDRAQRENPPAETAP